MHTRIVFISIPVLVPVLKTRDWKTEILVLVSLHETERKNFSFSSWWLTNIHLDNSADHQQCDLGMCWQCDCQRQHRSQFPELPKDRGSDDICFCDFDITRQEHTSWKQKSWKSRLCKLFWISERKKLAENTKLWSLHCLQHWHFPIMMFSHCLILR